MDGLTRLIEGFSSFRRHYYQDNPQLYRELTEEGQSPQALVIACCDSRVHPAQVFSTQPGDIFVIRNVANLVPPCQDDGKSHGTSAAIEFAVKHLKVKYIIVLGHAQCGGIISLMEGVHQDVKHGFIDPWMSMAMPARELVLTRYPDKPFEDQCKACEQASIGISLKNLMTFPWIKSKVESGVLELHGWYFDIEQGALLKCNQADGSFVPV